MDGRQCGVLDLWTLTGRWANGRRGWWGQHWTRRPSAGMNHPEEHLKDGLLLLGLQAPRIPPSSPPRRPALLPSGELLHLAREHPIKPCSSGSSLYSVFSTIGRDLICPERFELMPESMDRAPALHIALRCWDKPPLHRTRKYPLLSDSVGGGGQ